MPKTEAPADTVESPTKRETAAQLAQALFAFEVKANAAGTSIVDLLSTVARHTYGIDLRPTDDEIEAAGLDESAAA